MEQATNSEIFLRPRFKMTLEEGPQELIEKFKKAMEAAHCDFSGKIVGSHIVIDVPEKDAHFWSPQLHLEIEEIDNNETQLKGLFGPKPNVWSLFMFFHFLLAVGFIGISIMAYVKMTLGEPYLLPLIVSVLIPVVWIVLYFLGDMGKRRGKRQMEDLNDFMLEILS